MKVSRLGHNERYDNRHWAGPLRIPSGANIDTEEGGTLSDANTSLHPGVKIIFLFHHFEAIASKSQLIRHRAKTASGQHNSVRFRQRFIWREQRLGAF
jgi:hypothetical protein